MVIGARTKAALHVKKKRGERVGAIPLGYRLSDDPGKIEPDPREQEAIALIHELREDGLSLRAIDKELRRRGFRSRGGKRWHVQTLSNSTETGPFFPNPHRLARPFWLLSCISPSMN